MIRESHGDVFIEELSINQSLTFEYATKTFAQRGISFGDNNKFILDLVKNDGRYTNLGLLLSDQCTCKIKCAIFQGITKMLFKDRKEFGGSILKQIDDCLAYLMVFNRISSTFRGLYRIDRPDYPEIVIREAINNAVVHRDYYINCDILVSLFDDRMEIMSIGGLMPGITLPLMRRGVSISRNDALARLFHHVNITDAYGTGLPRIFAHYDQYGLVPDFPITEGGFLISLPNINYALEKLEKSPTFTAKSSSPKITKTENAILKRYAGREFDKNEVAKDFGIGESGAYKLLKRMLDKGLLLSKRDGRQFVYTIAP